MDNRHSFRGTANTAPYATAGLAPPRQGFVVRYWRGEASPGRTALVFILVTFLYPMLPGLLGDFVKQNVESGRIASLDYALAFAVIPLLSLVFIWAGVGLWRCGWHVLRRPWTVQNSFGKGTAMVGMLMSLGLLLGGPVITILTISDVMNPPPVHHTPQRIPPRR